MRSSGIQHKVPSYKGFLAEKLFLAPNAPSGVTLDYYAKAAGPVQVTVTDKSGAQIRQINARADAGVINRVVWDMRYDAPVTPPPGGRGGRSGRGGGRGETPAAEPTAQAEGGGGGGGGRGGLGNRGPLVDPGEYTVTIAAAGKTDSRTVTVEDDPRITVSPEDRAKRRQAITKLVALTKDADLGRRKIVAMNTTLTGLTDNWKKPGVQPVPENIKKAVEDLSARIKAVIGTFEAERQQGQLGGAGPAVRYVPPPISQKIGRLMGAIDGFDGPPTARQLADVEDASSELQAGLIEVNKLFDELPKLNKMMADAGVPYFTVDIVNVPPPAGRGPG